jgi:orotate phosphoribosyltransferase
MPVERDFSFVIKDKTKTNLVAGRADKQLNVGDRDHGTAHYVAGPRYGAICIGTTVRRNIYRDHGMAQYISGPRYGAVYIGTMARRSIYRDLGTAHYVSGPWHGAICIGTMVRRNMYRDHGTAQYVSGPWYGAICIGTMVRRRMSRSYYGAGGEESGGRATTVALDVAGIESELVCQNS